TSFEAAKASIDRWMDYYNNDRCQWDLAKLSPNEYYHYITTGEYPAGTMRRRRAERSCPSCSSGSMRTMCWGG
ncbi:IS3 family transposase, partial [Dysosmobacter sp.]|uniref:IS3 family transposase n=1 Tax=Dysosmobacter sp. TaxID=2591382 RepID=UPI003AB19695